MLALPGHRPDRETTPPASHDPSQPRSHRRARRATGRMWCICRASNLVILLRICCYCGADSCCRQLVTYVDQTLTNISETLHIAPQPSCDQQVRANQDHDHPLAFHAPRVFSHTGRESVSPPLRMPRCRRRRMPPPVGLSDTLVSIMLCYNFASGCEAIIAMRNTSGAVKIASSSVLDHERGIGHPAERNLSSPPF